MNVIIKRIRDAGIEKKERIVLEVIKETDIGSYIVFNTTSLTEDSVSNEVRHTYWFPDKTVKTGDFVVLYTKSGKQKEILNKVGTTSHFFYWGLEKTILNNKEDYVILLEIRDYVSKSAL